MDTKALKDKFLQLALQGKLVSQDENDEPVSVLLERIKKEKEKLIKDKKIKKEKPLPEITEDEIPYELPKGWEWVRLGNIGKIVGGGTPKTNCAEYFSKDEVAWLTPADLNDLKEKYIFKGKRYISKLGLEKSSAQLLPKGSVLFSSRAPIGYVAIAANPLSTNQGFKSCVLYEMSMNEFIYYMLKFKAKEINENASGTTFKEVSGTVVSQIIIPLPPLNEQKRIVKKIDSLFNLIDELENNKQDLLQNISNVRNKALQLAMKGKLVPQDENDEPVSVLLEKIKKEKEQLIKDKKLKKEKPLPEITEDEIPYELPNNWVWVRLGDLSNYIKAGGDKPKDFSEIKTKEYNIPVIANGKINNGIIGYTDEAKEFNTCITVSARGTIGYSFVRKDPFYPIVRLIVVCPNKHINFSYLDYAFKYFLAEGVGTSVKQLTVPMIKPKIIPLPPLEEQNRIVEKLDSIMQLCNELESELNN